MFSRSKTPTLCFFIFAIYPESINIIFGFVLKSDRRCNWRWFLLNDRFNKRSFSLLCYFLGWFARWSFQNRNNLFSSQFYSWFFKLTNFFDWNFCWWLTIKNWRICIYFIDLKCFCFCYSSTCTSVAHQWCFVDLFSCRLIIALTNFNYLVTGTGQGISSFCLICRIIRLSQAVCFSCCWTTYYYNLCFFFT